MSAGLIVGLVVAAFLCELLVFWAAAALADVPETGWSKFVVVPGSAAVVCAGLALLLCYLLGLTESPLAPDKRTWLYLGVGLVLALTWVIPAILFMPMLSVSMSRSMLIAILQFLLRLFLYVLITAVVLVVLAILQIVKRGETQEGARPDPTPRIVAVARL